MERGLYRERTPQEAPRPGGSAQAGSGRGGAGSGGNAFVGLSGHGGQIGQFGRGGGGGDGRFQHSGGRRPYNRGWVPRGKRRN
jgi:hypothetical protein